MKMKMQIRNIVISGGLLFLAGQGYASDPMQGEQQQIDPGQLTQQEWEQQLDSVQQSQQQSAFHENMAIEESNLSPMDRARFWICNARGARFEMHRGGHRASAYLYNRAYYAALNECKVFHPFCVVQCFLQH